MGRAVTNHRVRVVRRRRGRLRWVIVVVAGVAVGVFAGLAYDFLRTTHTSFRQMFSPPFGGRTFIRILALGEDNTSRRRATGYGLSDTIMVAAVDLDSKTVRAISIPRDTRVQVPGYGFQKINAAYAFGGPALATQAAQAVLRVPVDYFIKTDIAGLKNVVDLVGGVGIEVEKDMHYTDRRGGLYINLRKGYRHLDGDKALQYVRFRRDTMGDLTRIQRQQNFLRALAREIMAPRNWVHLPGIVDEMYRKQYVRTDMNAKDLLALARLARDVPPEQMEMATAPGVPQNIDGISYYIVDQAKTAEVVAKLLEYPSPSQAKVEVLNGSGVAGLAKAVADRLEQSGYEVTSTGNAASFNYQSSEIVVHNRNAAGADKIAHLVGAADIRSEPAADGTAQGADITVIVGRNYRQ